MKLDISGGEFFWQKLNFAKTLKGIEIEGIDIIFKGAFWIETAKIIVASSKVKIESLVFHLLQDFTNSLLSQLVPKNIPFKDLKVYFIPNNIIVSGIFKKFLSLPLEIKLSFHHIHYYDIYFKIEEIKAFSNFGIPLILLDIIYNILHNIIHLKLHYEAKKRLFKFNLADVLSPLNCQITKIDLQPGTMTLEFGSQIREGEKQCCLL